MEYIPITAISPEMSATIRQAFPDNMDKECSLIYTDYRENYNENCVFVWRLSQLICSQENSK